MLRLLWAVSIGKWKCFMYTLSALSKCCKIVTSRTHPVMIAKANSALILGNMKVQ